jgi:hypothetical protein
LRNVFGDIDKKPQDGIQWGAFSASNWRGEDSSMEFFPTPAAVLYHELIGKLYTFLLNYARLNVPDPSVAQDIVQGVYLIA